MKNPLSDKSVCVDVRDAWATPQFVFDYFNDTYEYNFDGAANHLNNKCENWSSDYFNHKTNKMEFNRVWINPPYSNIRPWIERAVSDKKRGILTTLLVPATPDASWWPSKASEYNFIVGSVDNNGKKHSGRIQFINALTGEAINGNPKGSVLLVFNPSVIGCKTNYIKMEDLKRFKK